jgi:hypothetical protein
MVATDSDGSLAPQQRKYPLPAEPNARARVILERLLAAYSEPKSTHPLNEATGVEEVFLRPLPQNAGQLAIVNLSSAFASNHPSGIEAETLTLLSIIGTLHANIPAITQVRFLVDGQPRDTLAGHADLSRIYLAAVTAPPLSGAAPQTAPGPAPPSSGAPR